MEEPLNSAPNVAVVDDLSAAEPVALSVVTLTPGGSKKKKDTPASRLKELQELQAKGTISDKEKKEMRKLKADEMCEMLGRGC